MSFIAENGSSWDHGGDRFKVSSKRSYDPMNVSARGSRMPYDGHRGGSHYHHKHGRHHAEEDEDGDEHHSHKGRPHHYGEKRSSYKPLYERGDPSSELPSVENRLEFLKEKVKAIEAKGGARGRSSEDSDIASINTKLDFLKDKVRGMESQRMPVQGRAGQESKGQFEMVNDKLDLLRDKVHALEHGGAHSKLSSQLDTMSRSINRLDIQGKRASRETSNSSEAMQKVADLQKQVDDLRQNASSNMNVDAKVRSMQNQLKAIECKLCSDNSADNDDPWIDN